VKLPIATAVVCDFAAAVVRWRFALMLMFFCAPSAFARPQSGSTPPIRVESDQVLVPTDVLLRWSVGRFGDLKVSDFRLLEDGKEQRIQQVTLEDHYSRLFVDNFGVREWEKAWGSGQKWVKLESQESGWFDCNCGPSYWYLLGYVPPPSAPGSCHHIKVLVNRKDADAFAADEYCKTPHTPSDPLIGTSLGKQMDDFAGSDDAAKIPLSLQVGFFYGDTKRARLFVTVEFPPGAIKFRRVTSGLRDEVAILTMVYGSEGTLVSRLSDLSMNKGPLFDGLSDISNDVDWARVFIPNHHEAQMEVPPGDYDVRLVVSDGTKLGRAQIPLTVDAYDGKELGLSSLVLCKQFHDHRQTLPSDQNLPSTLSDFVPLVSKGMEFTPAGDTNFAKDYPHKARLLFAYYEVYEPLLTSAPWTTVQTRMRIINTTTGALETDTGLRSASDWMEPGKSVIPVSEQIAAAKLAKGSYRVEVQASDSVGRTTPWRAASFTVE